MKIFILTLFLLLATFSNVYSQDFWEKTNGLDNLKIYSLAVNSSGDIYAGTDTTHSYYRSTDNGITWTDLGFDNLKTTRTVFKPSGEILLSTLDHNLGGGVFHSTDNGDSWANMGYTGAATSIAINSIGDIFAGTFNSGARRSTDNGGSWIAINQGLSDGQIRALLINSGDNIFAGTYAGGVFRSIDNGENWVQINQGLTNNTITSLAINSSGDIFAGTEGGGAFRSADNGENWNQINQGLTSEGLYVLSLAVNSNDDIFAGTFEGVFRSTDNGENWVKINQGLYNYMNVYSLAINSNGGIFAGTEDGVSRNIILANIKVYLEGPYAGGGAMTTTLNTNNLVPLNSNDAYSTLTYGYTASTVTSIPNSDIVDWVLVELRKGEASGTKVGTRAGFLKSDGTIVDTNGLDPLQFTGLGDGNYYVVVRHRNHLAIMSANAIPLSSNSALYDFSTAQLQAYGTNAMIDLGSEVMGMISGDTNNSGIISAADKSIVNSSNLANGYYIADTNFSGIVTAADKSNINSNNLKQTFVP